MTAPGKKGTRPRLLKLSPRQARFKDNLLEGMGMKEAYTAAGYTGKSTSAATNASRLLKNNPFLRQAYEEGIQRAADKAEVTQARILREDGHIAFSDIADIFDDKGSLRSPKDIPPAVRRSISSIRVIEKWDPTAKKMATTYEYKFWDKGKAVERLAKHLGMFEKDNMQRLDSGLLTTLLAGLPPEYAEQVKAELLRRSKRER